MFRRTSKLNGSSPLAALSVRKSTKRTKKQTLTTPELRSGYQAEPGDVSGMAGLARRVLDVVRHSPPTLMGIILGSQAMTASGAELSGPSVNLDTESDQVLTIDPPNYVIDGVHVRDHGDGRYSVTPPHDRWGFTGLDINTGDEGAKGITGHDVEISIGGTTIDASTLTIEELVGDPERPSGGRMVAENLRIGSDNAGYTADEATIEFSRLAEGGYQMRVISDATNYSNGDLSVNASGEVQSALTIGRGGNLAEIEITNSDELSYQHGDHIVDATGGKLHVTADERGAGVAVDAPELNITNGGQHFGMTNGRIDARYDLDPNGDRSIEMSGDRLDFTSASAHKNLTQLHLENFSAKNTLHADGSETLSIDRARNATMTLNGYDIALEQAQLTATSKDSELQNIAINFQGESVFDKKDGNLTLRSRNLRGMGTQQGDTIYADLQADAIFLRGPKQTAEVHGFGAQGTETNFHVRLDSALITDTVGKQLPGLTVEGVDVYGQRNNSETTNGKYLIDIAGASQTVDEVTVTAKTEGGQRIRLYMDTSSETVRAAALIMPEGGEIQLVQKDGTVTLGGGSIAGVQDKENDITHVVADNVEIDVEHTDGTASLNFSGDVVKAGDEVVINSFTGTANVATETGSVSLDVGHIDGFMFKSLGVEKGAQGARFVAIPTHDASSMSAKLDADVDGFHVGFEFRDVHQLEVLGQMSKNELRFRAADDSGQGSITAELGPLKLDSEKKAGYGSAIDLALNYNGFDAHKALEAVDGFTSSGILLGKYFGVTENGWVKVHTNRETAGIDASLAIKPMTHETRDAVSAVASLGARFSTADGTQSFGLYGGAIDASSVTWTMRQGRAELGGIELPDQFSIPSTLVGGLQWDSVEYGTRVNATLGAFANVVSALHEQGVIEEPVKTGITASFGVHNRDDGYRFNISGFKNLETHDPALEDDYGVKATFSIDL